MRRCRARAAPPPRAAPQTTAGSRGAPRWTGAGSLQAGCRVGERSESAGASGPPSRHRRGLLCRGGRIAGPPRITARRWLVGSPDQRSLCPPPLHTPPSPPPPLPPATCPPPRRPRQHAPTAPLSRKRTTTHAGASPAGWRYSTTAPSPYGLATLSPAPYTSGGRERMEAQGTYAVAPNEVRTTTSASRTSRISQFSTPGAMTSSRAPSACAASTASRVHPVDVSVAMAATDEQLRARGGLICEWRAEGQALMSGRGRGLIPSASRAVGAVANGPARSLCPRSPDTLRPPNNGRPRPRRAPRQRALFCVCCVFRPLGRCSSLAWCKPPGQTQTNGAACAAAAAAAAAGGRGAGVSFGCRALRSRSWRASRTRADAAPPVASSPPPTPTPLPRPPHPPPRPRPLVSHTPRPAATSAASPTPPSPRRRRSRCLW